MRQRRGVGSGRLQYSGPTQLHIEKAHFGDTPEGLTFVCAHIPYENIHLSKL